MMTDILKVRFNYDTDVLLDDDTIIDNINNICEKCLCKGYDNIINITSKNVHNVINSFQIEQENAMKNKYGDNIHCSFQYDDLKYVICDKIFESLEEIKEYIQLEMENKKVVTEKIMKVNVENKNSIFFSLTTMMEYLSNHEIPDIIHSLKEEKINILGHEYNLIDSIKEKTFESVIKEKFHETMSEYVEDAVEEIFDDYVEKHNIFE